MATSTVKRPLQEATPFDPKAAQRLVEEAMKQPGVRELMEAYGEAKRYQDATEAYQSVMATRTVEWATDSTTAECV
jgi:hypothetical protein